MKNLKILVNHYTPEFRYTYDSSAYRCEGRVQILEEVCLKATNSTLAILVPTCFVDEKGGGLELAGMHKTR